MTSQSKRRSTSISLISSRVWPTDDRKIPPLPPAPFTAGSQVLWLPVTTSNEGKIRRITPKCSNGSGPAVSGWLAVRQPPYQAQREYGDRDLHFCFGDGTYHSRSMPRESSWCTDPNEHVRVITTVFDLRFLIRIMPHANPSLSRLSSSGHTLVVTGYGPYHLPCITVRTIDGLDTILWKLDPRNISPFSTVLLKCEWLEVELIRSLDAF